MSNHYHLLIETPDGNLSQGIRQLNGVYTQHFNREHRRVGHVFQGRYKGILVEKESYLLELGYSMREIGDYFGLHYSRVSQIISKSRLKNLDFP